MNSKGHHDEHVGLKIKRISLESVLERIFEGLTLEKILQLSKEDVIGILHESNFLGKVADQIIYSIYGNGEEQAVYVNSKYAEDGATLCNLGCEEAFNNGLDALIGIPNSRVFKAMVTEHNDNSIFMTSNYKLWTTPKTEMAFLLGHPGDFADLVKMAEVVEKDDFVSIPSAQNLESLQRQNKSLLYSSGEDIRSLETTFVELEKLSSGGFEGTVDSPKVIDKLRIKLSVADHSCTLANEILTGLAALCEKPEDKEKVLCSIQHLRWHPKTIDDCIILPPCFYGREEEAKEQMPKGSKLEEFHFLREVWKFTEAGCEDVPNFKPARKRTTLTELMNDQLVRIAKLRLEEAIAAYTYTGPMYEKWNAELRNAGQNWKEGKSPRDFKFTTSIHALVSAINKLAQKSGIPPNRKVYRGLTDFALSKNFISFDDRQTRGGVEFSFLSTTTEQSVALRYSGGARKRGIMFEISVGKIDSGAQMGSFSQYKMENEVLFSPLAYLEIVGGLHVDTFAGTPVMIVPIKVNVNQKGLTLQDRIDQRKQELLEMIDKIRKEIIYECARFVTVPKDGPQSDTSAERTENLNRAVDRILELESLVNQEDSIWFNSDENFKESWNYILYMKNQAISQWLGDEWMEKLTEAELTPKQFWAKLKELRDAYTSEVVAECARNNRRKDNTHHDNKPLENSLREELVRWNRERDERRNAMITSIFSFQKIVSCVEAHWRNALDYETKWKEFVVQTNTVVENLSNDVPAAVRSVFNNGPAFVRDKICYPSKSTNILMQSLVSDPLTQCATSGTKKEIRILFAEEMDEFLHNSDPVWENTPLHWASYYGNEDIVEELIEARADPSVRNQKDLFDWTPLHLAVWQGHTKIVASLLATGREDLVNATDKYRTLLPAIPRLAPRNWTPLHIAAAHGHLSIIETLIEHKADLNAKDSDNRSPLDVVDFWALDCKKHLEDKMKAAEEDTMSETPAAT